MQVQALPQSILVNLEQFSKGRYQLSVVNAAGSLVASHPLTVAADGNSTITVALKNVLGHGVYYAAIRNEEGVIIAKANFYY